MGEGWPTCYRYLCRMGIISLSDSLAGRSAPWRAHANRATRPETAGRHDRLRDPGCEDRDWRSDREAARAIGQGPIRQGRWCCARQQAEFGGTLGHCPEGSGSALGMTVSISSMSAAKTACEAGGWKLSNLEINKLLYLAQMKFLDQYGHPIIEDKFEAWKYGPVVSKLYHRLKSFGSDPVKDIFFVKRRQSLPNHQVIKNIVREFGDLEPFELVKMTHRPGGAWDTYYIPDVSGIVIPNRAIAKDYKEAWTF